MNSIRKNVLWFGEGSSATFWDVSEWLTNEFLPGEDKVK